LTQGKPTAIGHTASFEGLGGLGKTQLAVEYAYDYDGGYPNGVVWINADQDINAQLTDIAVTACWVAPETEHKFKLDVALHRLRSFSNCLIIYDNVEDIAAIQPYLPLPFSNPHLLITSRNSQPGFIAIPLDPLNEVQSMQLLVQEAGRQPIGVVEEEAACNIVDQLDGLPLALELAGAYLRHRTTMPFAHYRDRLLSDPIKSLSYPYLSSFTKHDSDLLRTLKVEEDVLLDEPFLADILDILTWSGPAAMGLSLLAALLGKNLSEISGALALGTQLKLLQKRGNDERYSLHRLVREVRRGEKPIVERELWVNLVCERLGNWFEALRDDFLQLTRFDAEIDHLVAWCDNSKHGTQLLACRLTWLQAYPAYHRGMWKKAHDLVLKSKEIYDHASLTDTKLYAHLLNDLSTTYSCIGQYSLALDYEQKALDIRREVLGELNQDTALSYHNLGLGYTKMGNSRAALKYLEKALEIYRELLGENNFHTARAYCTTAYTYRLEHDYRSALPHIETALNICRQIFGERHPQTAASYNEAGIIYSALKNNAAALFHLEKALEIRLELFAERHPDTAISLDSLGVFFTRLGDTAKGLEYHKKALNIHRQLDGDRHPETATTLCHIGHNYFLSGRYEKAIQFYLDAQDIQRECLGNLHPFAIETYLSVSTCLDHMQQYDEAIRLLFEGFKLAKEAFPKHHPMLKQFERKIHELTARTARRGFRSPSIHSKKKNRR